ncbi:MAG: hypothetical protein ACLPH3_10755 [Terracidiphilus sp.]
MAKGFVKAGEMLRTGLVVAVLALLTCPFRSASAAGLLFRHRKSAADDAAQKKGPTASQPPAFSIPVEPLGFNSPGPYYQGQRESLVSLDFLDEDKLLFTFRAPGLIHRTSAGDDQERQIRAEVLTLPQGTLEAEALWTLHDHERYLWMLHDGRFLLRDEDILKEGNAKLELRPLLQFPGPLFWMEMDPAQHYLVTDSHEPSSVKAQKGQVGSPGTAESEVLTDDPSGDEQRDVVLRILDRHSGQVMLVSRVRATVHLPINSDGYLETLHGSGREWVLNLKYFGGGSKVLGKLESSCQPPIDFVSIDEALVNTCVFQNGRRLIAMSTRGQKLWEAPSPPTQIWPILVMAPNGSRVARETLTVNHSVEDFARPLDTQDIKGQLVEVYDSIGGSLLLKAPANPTLDAGGNVAISPSGKRVAILNAGAIEVYELPAAGTSQHPTLPVTPESKP